MIFFPIIIRLYFLYYYYTILGTLLRGPVVRWRLSRLSVVCCKGFLSQITSVYRNNNIIIPIFKYYYNIIYMEHSSSSYGGGDERSVNYIKKKKSQEANQNQLEEKPYWTPKPSMRGLVANAIILLSRNNNYMYKYNIYMYTYTRNRNGHW